MSCNEVTNSSKTDCDTEEILVLTWPKKVFSFDERMQTLRDEWIAFATKEITDNIEPWFHLWAKDGARHTAFIDEIEWLANKYLSGILTDDSIMAFRMLATTFRRAMGNHIKGGDTLDMVITFLKNFTYARFEFVSEWNWFILRADMTQLQPYLADKERPVFDRSTNGGFPSWVKYEKQWHCGCTQDPYTDEEDDDSHDSYSDGEDSE